METRPWGSPTRQTHTHTQAALKYTGQRNRVSPRASVMTSEAKYEVSQFWSLSRFQTETPGVREGLGLLLTEQSRLVTRWLLGLQENIPLLRVHTWPL